MSPVVADTSSSAAATLAAVADPMRWQILMELAGHELCTTHLQEVLGAKQTLVSHHLRVLREAGLVDTAPCGRFTYYRLRAGAFDTVRDELAHMAQASHGESQRRAC